MQRLAFPLLSRCPICRKQASTQLGCCAECRETLFQRDVRGDSVVLGPYRGTLEQAVRAFKFHHATRLADLFALELARLVHMQGWTPDAVCGVPLHRRRYWQRGYDQAYLLAGATARRLELPHLALLRRTRPTKQQARLGRAERLSNVAHAFQASTVAKRLRGKCVLLVDDVITSGATTDACRAALLASGVAEVKLGAVARANL